MPKFQVKSSGQWLKINGQDSPIGTKACQGNNPTTLNYLWEIIDAGTEAGWCLLQVQDTGQYLNIQSEDNTNGAAACQELLPDPITDNFLWKIVPDPNNTGWSRIQVKSSNQYLNIKDSSNEDGAGACQGDNPDTPNFLWMQCNNADPKDVIVTLNLLNCAAIYALNDGTHLSIQQANDNLSMEDDNLGAKEDHNQNSFETILNPGSWVTWKPVKGSDSSNSPFTVNITRITYEQGTGNNVLGPITAIENSGSVKAQVLYTAIPPDSGDNEAYTITFTLNNGSRPKTYSFDPKIKINPSN